MPVNKYQTSGQCLMKIDGIPRCRSGSGRGKKESGTDGVALRAVGQQRRMRRQVDQAGLLPGAGILDWRRGKKALSAQDCGRRRSSSCTTLATTDFAPDGDADKKAIKPVERGRAKSKMYRSKRCRVVGEGNQPVEAAAARRISTPQALWLQKPKQTTSTAPDRCEDGNV